MRRNLRKTRLGSRRPGRGSAVLAERPMPGRREGVPRVPPQEPARGGARPQKRASIPAPLRKLASPRGLSLAETLVCCLILSLSSSVLIQTMALAGEHFNTRTRESSARILCNILSQSVQEYLSCASDWTTGPDNSVTDFTTGAIPSFEDPVRCSFIRTAEGFLALDYGSPETPLLLAPPSDYSMQSGRPTLEVEFCNVTCEEGIFSVSIRVAPNRLGPQWDGAMQEVQNNFVVYPVSAFSAEETGSP